jgi:hypothetical protein
VVDELEQLMEVEPTVGGQPPCCLGGEACLEKTAQAPALDFQRGSVSTTTTGDVVSMLHGHVLLVSLGAGSLTSSPRPGKNRAAGDTNTSVTLSTISRSGTLTHTVAPEANSRPVAFAACVCAGSAGVHAALVLPHSHESASLAAAFAVSAVALAVAAVALELHPRANVTTVVALLLVGVAVAYALSRTTGIPGLTVHPEPLDAFGTVVSCLELAAAWALVRPATRRSRS